ncbi:hypothetical protein X762_21685 [Mesorhizobium sp. LSHC426A00]|nr:hypothetical protein X762_21685 [Mesorhizobium sp. LSHC426A00]ESX54454.1 hypothetical protein X761_16555 [Mesorhizobium sp. LSHC424B00]ESX72377.1 hypothetical protein X758_14865 [Mesorhizobium sp. LSHC416B00]
MLSLTRRSGEIKVGIELGHSGLSEAFIILAAQEHTAVPQRLEKEDLA